MFIFILCCPGESAVALVREGDVYFSVNNILLCRLHSRRAVYRKHDGESIGIQLGTDERGLNMITGVNAGSPGIPGVDTARTHRTECVCLSSST